MNKLLISLLKHAPTHSYERRLKPSQFCSILNAVLHNSASLSTRSDQQNNDGKITSLSTQNSAVEQANDKTIDDQIVDLDSYSQNERVPRSSVVNKFYPTHERFQRPLLKWERKGLVRRIEIQKRLGNVFEYVVGQRALYSGWLHRLGCYIACHELLQVRVAKECPLDPDVVHFIIEESLDCIVLNRRGSSFAVFRDRRLPLVGPLSNDSSIESTETSLAEPVALRTEWSDKPVVPPWLTANDTSDPYHTPLLEDIRKERIRKLRFG